jgi:hypothetical protein
MRLLTLAGLLIVFMLPSKVSSQVYNLETSEPYAERLEEPSLYPKKEKEKECQPQDLGDLFRSIFGKNKEREPRAAKKFSYLILPNISSNPANGFLLGAGGNLAWYLGPMESTRISLVGFSAAVTTKEQFISFVKSNIYTKDNLFFLQGDWRYYHYRLPTYGLGTGSPPDTMNYQGSWGWQGETTEDFQGAYPMLYDFFKFHQTVSRKVADNFYVGIGYMLDYYWNIEDELLQLDTVPYQFTPHWGYSRKYEFDTSRYMLSGLSINLLYDSRDNMINPYKGYYANLNYRMNQTWLGSDQSSSTLWVEFRTYIGLSKKKRHLIGFWLFGDFEITGKRPYLTLMALGEDQKGRSGRGYIAGRFRGEHYVYGEVEYRFPISQCSEVLGGVIFANATTASNLARERWFFDEDGNVILGDDGRPVSEPNPVQLFEYIMPAFGFGLRFMINKYTRLNLNFDFGLGIKSRAFYFSGTETF